MPRIYDNPVKARHYANYVVSDIKIYTEHYTPGKLEKSIEEDNFFEVFEEDIERGRAQFKEKVTPEIFEMNIYEKAVVDVMIYKVGHIKSSIW